VCAAMARFRHLTACARNRFVSKIFPYMRRFRIAGLLLVSMATLAQQAQPVEITSEPRHHLVLENQLVRVFDVTVEPKGSTLVHRHNHDYLFVTLGDSDVVSERPGEKPVHLVLQDGETRFTPGNFAHAAINNREQPFHNITVELLQPSSNVKSCKSDATACAKKSSGPNIGPLITSDQWTVLAEEVAPGGTHTERKRKGPALLVLVSGGRAGSKPGELKWADKGTTLSMQGSTHAPSHYVLLLFPGEAQ
jgi:quercetin dioxygenase-like cupin family protein